MTGEPYRLAAGAILPAAVLVAVLAGGCVVIPVGGSLPAGVGSKAAPLDRNVWLAPVEVTDPDISAEGNALIAGSLTLNLARSLGASRVFRNVNTLPGSVGPDDLVFRIRATRYFARRSMHPLYLPGAILTLTLYIWFGGPVSVDRSTYDLSLSVELADGTPVTEVRVESEAKKNISIWSSASLDMLGARGSVFEDLIGKAVAAVTAGGNR